MWTPGGRSIRGPGREQGYQRRTSRLPPEDARVCVEDAWPAAGIGTEPNHVVAELLEPRLGGLVALLHVRMVVDRAVDVDSDLIVLVEEVRSCRRRLDEALAAFRHPIATRPNRVQPRLFQR